MHVPDGFLSTRIWVAFDAVSGASLLYAARRVRLESSARTVPMMGVLSAFVFASQLLNFPVLGGTSGHLVGGALLAIVLGPLPGFLTMATVIVAQALLLQDGGIAALGANVFNIGAVPVLTGYVVFRLVAGGKGRGRRLALGAFAAGWASLVLSAACCALELALSRAIPLGIALPAMVGYHSVIGLVEGALTGGVLVFLERVRPDLLESKAQGRLAFADWVVALALVALPCAILALGGASRLPDPLERLLESSGGPGHP
jgi:cobalt/nickel transport system permease protein